MNYFKSPITTNLVITDNCNANCLFCSIKNNKQEDFVPLEDIKSTIDILKENDILRINFFGGEPFIYPKIKEAIKYAKDNEFFVSAVSNGLNINLDTCKEIKDYIDVIGISVHGLKGSHEKLMGVEGSFDRALDSIGNLASQGIKVGINITITGLNYTEVIPLVDYIKSKYDIKFVSLNRYITNKYISPSLNKKLIPTIKQLENTLYDLDELDNRYSDISFKYAIHFPYCIIKNKKLLKYVGRCGFGENYCSIDMKGNMKMCSYGGPILGNIKKLSIKEIWNNNKSLTEYRTENWMPDKCKKCDDKSTCTSGCKLSSGKDNFEPDIMIQELEV